MLVLFDQGTPLPLRQFLSGHTIRTAYQQQWATLENGELLDAAEAAGFDLLLTTDTQMRYQQNLAGRRIAIVALGQARWPLVRMHVAEVVAAVNAATPGSYIEVAIPESLARWSLVGAVPHHRPARRRKPEKMVDGGFA